METRLAFTADHGAMERIVTSRRHDLLRPTTARRRDAANFSLSVDAPTHTALWETVAFGLRQAIIRGDLLPGLHLEEPALADRFEVSRSSVREALSQLAHEGLVHIEPRRGAFVVGLTEAVIRDIYELRLMLETHSARRAAERADAEAIADLHALVDQIGNAVNHNRPDLQAQSDLGVHRQIVVLGGNDRILAAWEPNAGVIVSMMSVAATAEFSRQVAVARHREIVRALELRDASALESYLRTMMDSSQRLMIDTLHSVQAKAHKASKKED